MQRIWFALGLLATAAIGAEKKSERPEPAPTSSSAGKVDALVEAWKAPVYPAEALRAKIGGRVVVRVVLDEAGNVIAARVLTTPHPQLGEAAVTAAKAWKFTPAVENSKPVHVCLDVPFEFDAAKGQKGWKPSTALPEQLIPQSAPRIEPRATKSVEAVVPAQWRERRLPGIVTFACLVRPDGRAQNFRIVETTHADLVPPALAAAEAWEFVGGTQGDLQVAAEFRGVLKFESGSAKPEEILAANGLAASDRTVPLADVWLERTVDPVWPYPLLLEGQTGSAVAEFTVPPDGKVADVKLREASRPAFGHALTAALEQWAFRPASAEGRAAPVVLVKRVEFKRPGSAENAAAEEALAGLIERVVQGKVVGGTGLDEKPTPRYQIPAEYPAALLSRGRPSGRAVIEFIIDRDGRCRLPRILSATEEEFGWAGVTAVSQWFFKAPTRGGQPTEVRVQIPFNFAPPEN